MNSVTQVQILDKAVCFTSCQCPWEKHESLSLLAPAIGK